MIVLESHTLSQTFNQSLPAKMSSTTSLPKPTKTSVQVISNTSDSQPNEKRRVDSSHDISDNISQLTINTDLSLILRQFECCVCLEHITPPILQCRNSHVFCQTCRQKFKSPLQCPTCRVELIQPDIRSHSLEQIAGNLRLPFRCKYSLYGCDVTSLLTEKAKHEDLCEHKPFRCPDMSEVCYWSGSGDQLVQHLIDEHNYRRDIRSKICSTSQTIDLVDLKFKSTNTIWPSLLNYKNQNFIIIKKYHYNIFKKEYQIQIFVLFIGEQRIANKFKYKIEIINQSNGKQLQWSDKPIPIRSDIKWLLSFRKIEGFSLDQIMIDKLSFNNYLKITITIESEEM